MLQQLYSDVYEHVVAIDNISIITACACMKVHHVQVSFKLSRFYIAI